MKIQKNNLMNTKKNIKKIKTNSLYIHIPFCRNICPYCDFVKIIKNQRFEDLYIDKICKDLDEIYNNFYKFKTIYIGGGTPSSLSIFNLKKLLNKINLLKLNECEITFEANPEDINEELLKLLKDNNINRISIGIQSFNKETLKKLHRVDLDFFNLIELTKKYITNISLDFIYGLPEENIDIINANISYFCKLNVEHVSIYSLTIHPNTYFYNQGIKEIDEDLNREMYDIICKRLKEAGFNQYEVSNFSKNRKFESKHNLNYWKSNEFLGVGLGAFGYINGYRYSMTKNLNKYLSNDVDRIYFKEKLTDKEKLEEFIMLNLRTKYGINFNDYKKKFNKDFVSSFNNLINKLVSDKLIKKYKNKIVATHEGIAILDLITIKFFDEIK